MNEIDEEVLQDLYSWVDSIPLTRPKKNIARDFSDGVLMAEIVKHYFPKLIEIHSYPSCNAVSQKKKNWHLLNWKAFKKLNFELSDDVIVNLVDAKVGTIERVLLLVRTKMDRMLFSRKYDDSPGRQSDRRGDSNPAKEETREEPRQGRDGAMSVRIQVEELKQECLAKDETIEILQAKIRKLEHLLELKDLRIEDLQKRLGDLRPTAQNKQILMRR